MNAQLPGNLFSQWVYTEPTDRQINFYCREFQAILDTINLVLSKYDVPILQFNSTNIIKSKYDIVSEFKCRSMWRITSDDYPALLILCSTTVKKELKEALSENFAKYLGETLKINTFTDKKEGVKKASIVIMPGGLDENTYTEEDLIMYGKYPAVTARLDALEDRMYRWAGDIRTKSRRWADFADANKYEPVLTTLSLKNISGLSLAHSSKRFSIDPPDEPDFTGVVKGVNCTVEAKSTRDVFTYQDTPESPLNFAKYWATKQTSLGSLHNADYVLFISKCTGDIVCLERNNPINNWLAGKLALTEV
jgi:hypothetical protein